ncbi:enoyl-CoA hydratase-related protein [uncultured Jatrophihabitans sp.]|uniref:enoyl-CoA hydratase-related protein n=1 Tax=uncultured Jatrophihabitans sp. TaxID=1610747 RepID=UPI0035CAC1A6
MSSGAEHVACAVEGGRATIRLTRPEKRNAITTAMYAVLADRLTEIGADGAVRVVVLTGSGGSFTAGNDRAELSSLPAEALGPQSPPRRFLDALAALPQVLVVGVDGPAIGIGTTVLLHADLVYATRASRFALPFVGLGLVPEAAATLLLPRVIGRARASALALLGAPIDADQAAAWGLLSAVVDGGQDELDAALDVACDALLAAPAEALAHTRRLLREDLRAATRDRLEEDGMIMQQLTARQGERVG